MKNINLEPYLIEAKKYTNKDIFGVFLYGSQNYNLNNAESDIDVRCLVFPDNQYDGYMETVEVILDNEERIEYMDIRIFFLALCEENLTLLETLRTNYYIINEKYDEDWKKLKENIDVIAYLNPEQFLSNIQLLVVHQVDNYLLGRGNQKLLARCGYAGKSLHHLFRFKDIVERYRQRESFETIFYARNKQSLIEIKRGKWPRAMADAAIRELVDFFDFSVEVLETPNSQKNYIWSIINNIYKKRGWR